MRDEDGMEEGEDKGVGMDELDEEERGRNRDEGNRWGREGSKRGHEGCGGREENASRWRGNKGKGRRRMETDLLL